MKDKKEKQKQRFAEMEQKLKEIYPREDDRMFYYHSSEDRIVLSHAIFWVMTLPQFLKGKIRKEKYFLLLRQYEEEMMDAFLMEEDLANELLDDIDFYNNRVKCRKIEELMPQLQELVEKEKWMKNYVEVVGFIKKNHRNPSKYRIEEHNMLNWLKASRKLINAGKMKPERVKMFEELQELMEEYKRVNQYQ